jgi:exodeoxyribonuclease VII large subunit
MERSARARLAGAERELGHRLALLDARDYRRRGFALVRDGDGRAVTSVSRLRPRQEVSIELADGRADATVERTSPAEGQQ